MRWLSAFTAAAARYWLSVYFAVHREIQGWEKRALAIPDPTLRLLAITALRCERGNLEGAAAFAAFAPRAHRVRIVRASVAFQAAYDYADALSEQPSPDPVGNALSLHSVLPHALGAPAGEVDYYRMHSHRRDGGYLRQLRDTCLTAVHALPFYDTVAEAVRDGARRIVTYQCLNLSEPQGGRDALARWALAHTPPGCDLRWWETAAAAGSSMLVFALIACAAEPPMRTSEVSALTLAYFPWIGALHTLLDSLVDEPEDRHTGYRSLLDYYCCPAEAAARFKTIAAEAVGHAQALPTSIRHRMVLAAMTSFYLSAAPRDSVDTALIHAQALSAMGELATPTMLVMRARRRVRQLKSRRSAASRDGIHATDC